MTNQCPAPEPTGPLAPDTRILDAARDLFFAHGFSAVSTDRLSRQAGVSKSTIYKYFGDMTGVFAAVVRRQGDIYQLGFETLPDTADAFWASLVGFGDRLLALLNQDFCIELDRMLHEEARKQPGLVRNFYDLAYGRAHSEVTRMMAHGKDRGFITKPQPAADLADNLLSMWEGLCVVRSRLGLSERPFENSSRWSRQCVTALFERDATTFLND
jgi:TetR/AcrR family transcriptional regulator, mexJK operon transcriptional repressor